MESSAKSETVADISEFLQTGTQIDREKLKESSILLFNKPKNWTSFKLVKKVKYITGSSRVGHAGTLDPLAEGLMIICTGKCTRMIESLQNMRKTYTGTFRFGKTTPSYDLETEFNGEFPFSHITPELTDQVLQDFKGDIMQTPPVYSAIRVGGKRAYKFARNGEELVLKSRPVHIFDFKVDYELPDMNFEVSCSKGTYIRSLAHDLAIALSSGCYLDNLKRTAIGEFNLKDAFEIENFQELCGF